MSTNARTKGLFDSKIIGAASIDALRKLDPRKLAKNPVIFVTEVVSLVVTGFFIRDVIAQSGTALFSVQIAFWLWLTVLFADFAEAVAAGPRNARQALWRFQEPERRHPAGQCARPARRRRGSRRGRRHHPRRRRNH